LITGSFGTLRSPFSIVIAVPDIALMLSHRHPLQESTGKGLTFG
jgi:hypothetical protein